MAAVLLVVIGIVVYFVRPSTDDRTGSEAVSEGRVDIGQRSPDSYRITYRVETYNDDEVTEATEVVTVKRPFDARVVTRDSRGKDARVTVNTFARYAIGGETFYVQPGAPEADLRPAAVLPDAVDDGYAEQRELRRVAGRLCRVYRIGDSTDSVSLPPLDDLGPDTSDVCVDSSGLVLEEATFTKDELTRRRIATKVDAGPAGANFNVKRPANKPAIVGSVLELERDSRLPGGDFWQLDDPPPGFKHRGRYAVVPPGQQGFSDVTARGSIITFLSEVWTSGSDAFTIDQGATQGTKPFEADPNARREKVGKYEADVRYSARGSEVRWLTVRTRFVRIRGTLPPSRLLAIARSLETVPGGPLLVAD